MQAAKTSWFDTLAQRVTQRLQAAKPSWFDPLATRLARTSDRSFAERMLLLVVIMTAIAAFELYIGLVFGVKDMRVAGVAWLYGVAIYGVCLVMFSRGVTAEMKAGFLIAAVLTVAVIHTSYEIWADASAKPEYEIPKFDADTWVSMAVALFGAGLLYKFRGHSNSLISAAWVMALVDIATNLEVIITIAILGWAGSGRLAMGSDLFDVFVTALAAIAIGREAYMIRRRLKSDTPNAA